MLLGTKSGTGMSAASLRGSYGIARTVAGFPGGTEAVVLAGRGTASFDGSGSCRVSVTDAEYALDLATGAIASYPDTYTFPCSYSVSGCARSNCSRLSVLRLDGLSRP